MKYILFAGKTYYPRGGAGDFIGMFNSVDAAIEHFEKETKHRFIFATDFWANIFDVENAGITMLFHRGEWKECSGVIDDDDIERPY